MIRSIIQINPWLIVNFTYFPKFGEEPKQWAKWKTSLIHTDSQQMFVILPSPSTFNLKLKLLSMSVTTSVKNSFDHSSHFIIHDTKWHPRLTPGLTHTTSDQYWMIHDDTIYSKKDPSHHFCQSSGKKPMNWPIDGIVDNIGENLSFFKWHFSGHPVLLLVDSFVSSVVAPCDCFRCSKKKTKDVVKEGLQPQHPAVLDTS